MKLSWKTTPNDPVRVQLCSVSKKLAKAYRQEARRLLTSPETLAGTDALHAALRSLTAVRMAIEQMLHDELLNAERVKSLLGKQRERMQSVIRKEKLDSYFRASQISVLTMNLLFLAEDELSEDIRVAPSPLQSETAASASINRVSITTDLIYQMHHNLFPAEKMLVASGQRNGNGVTVGAVFEVTGKSSSGHVRADPTRLARALIAMDLSNTHFALWVHSHPGTGKEWTRPSSIDLGQHRDWLRDFSPNLVSVIMVQDRWIRFWGTALDSGQLTIELVGPGVIRENGNEAVYRLEQ